MAFTTLGCNCDKCGEVEVHSCESVHGEGLLAEGRIGEFPEDMLWEPKQEC